MGQCLSSAEDPRLQKKGPPHGTSGKHPAAHAAAGAPPTRSSTGNVGLPLALQPSPSQALLPSASLSQVPASPAPSAGHKAVSFAEHNLDGDGSNRDRSASASASRGGSRRASGSNNRTSAGTGRTSSNRTSRSSRRQSSVGADLNALVDDHGQLHQMVSRQLSRMSHISVHSECGTVYVTKEEGKAPFTLTGLIGRGGFGNVYLGTWEGKQVAIKVIAGDSNEGLAPEQQKWLARRERMAQMEAVLMSAIQHDNIVNTFKVTCHSGDDVDADLVLIERRLLAGAGVVQKEGAAPAFEWHIIMEFCDKGSLSKELASFNLHRPCGNGMVSWNAWASLELLKEIALALMFLHEHKIVHGDLKAANVLLASAFDVDRRGWVAKVSDFGLSRVMRDCSRINTLTFGTVTHMPPELLSKGTLLPSSDVYAFGVLMWEVFTAEKVFRHLSDSEVILAVVTKKLRPTFPKDCPSKYRFLAEKCWAEMPELRPSLAAVLRDLNTIQAALCPEGEDSPALAIQVYPTRATVLEKLEEQQAKKAGHRASVEQAAAAVKALTSRPANPPKPALKTSQPGGVASKDKQVADARLRWQHDSQEGAKARARSFSGGVQVSKDKQEGALVPASDTPVA